MEELNVNYLTHCLDVILLLLIACFPAGFNMIIPTKNKYPIQTHCIINVFLAVFLSMCLEGHNLKIGFNLKQQYIICSIALMIFVGIMCIIVEYAIAQMFYYIKHKSLAKSIRIPTYQNCKWHILLLVVIQSVSEEIVLRCTVFYIMHHVLGINNIAILITVLTMIFAFNHIFAGREQILQKLFIGAIISILFVVNDGIIWYAVVPHIVLNTSYFILAKRRWL